MPENNTSKISKKDLVKVFWRSLSLQGSFNFERMQGLGYAYAMIPIIKKLYKAKEDISKALKRHLEFFNTTPQVSTFIMGLSAAMEEEASENPDFDKESINAAKASLMGPLAGIGDSFFWGTFRVIAAGIGISLAKQGNILGPILFLLIYNIPAYLIRYYGLFLGYKAGSKYLNYAYESGLMERLTFAASIIGLTVVGAMTSSMVGFSTPLVIKISGAQLKLQQDVFDKILPSGLPLLLTLFTLHLVKKGVKTTYIMLGLLAFGVLGKIIGIL